MTMTEMKKVFHFDSPPDPYVADAAVLCCFDQRIRLAVRKFLDKREIKRPDMIVIAGGARILASPRNDFERDFILEQFKLSIQLHKTTKAYLMSHSDCATYGGLAAFGNDREMEAKHNQEELKRAAEVLRTAFPDFSAECFFVTFDGINSLELKVVEQVA